MRINQHVVDLAHLILAALFIASCIALALGGVAVMFTPSGQ